MPKDGVHAATFGTTKPSNTLLLAIFNTLQAVSNMYVAGLEVPHSIFVSLQSRLISLIGVTRRTNSWVSRCSPFTKIDGWYSFRKEVSAFEIMVEYDPKRRPSTRGSPLSAEIYSKRHPERFRYSPPRSLSRLAGVTPQGVNEPQALVSTTIYALERTPESTIASR